MKPPSTTAEVVRTAIARTRLGEPFASRRLATQGRSSAAVQRELSRLAKAGVLQRVAHGVFVRPEHSAYVSGPVPPELTKVVEAIAERTGSKVQMSGAEAASRLGLSTQVPMQAVFQTTGPSRTLKVGSRIVRLKHVAPRKLALTGKPAGVALAALWYLGKREVTPSTFEKLERKLGAREFKALAAAKSHMPAWMVKALQLYEASRRHDG